MTNDAKEIINQKKIYENALQADNTRLNIMTQKCDQLKEKIDQKEDDLSKAEGDLKVKIIIQENNCNYINQIFLIKIF